MITISVENAKKELAALIERARGGEEVILSDGEGPDVKLTPLAAEPSYRGCGVLKDKIAVSDEDLFEPLSEEEIRRWWGESGQT